MIKGQFPWEMISLNVNRKPLTQAMNRSEERVRVENGCQDQNPLKSKEHVQ